MESRENADGIEVDLRLFFLKPKVTCHLVCQPLQPLDSEGKRHLMNRWEKAGFAGVARGETSLNTKVPFKQIDNAHQ